MQISEGTGQVQHWRWRDSTGSAPLVFLVFYANIVGRLEKCTINCLCCSLLSQRKEEKIKPLHNSSKVSSYIANNVKTGVVLLFVPDANDNNSASAPNHMQPPQQLTYLLQKHFDASENSSALYPLFLSYILT